MKPDDVALLMDRHLPVKPEVTIIGNRTGLDRWCVIGRLAVFWAEAGRLMDKKGLVPERDGRWLDALVQCDGFAVAMESAGWLVFEKKGLLVPKPDRCVVRPRKEKAKDEAVFDQALFDTFWAAYPPGRNVGRPKAEASWTKLKVDAALAAKILAGLAKWKASWQWTKDGGEFIPGATTFLNQRRWEDEPGPDRGEGGAAGPGAGRQPGGRGRGVREDGVGKGARIKPEAGKYAEFE